MHALSDLTLRLAVWFHTTAHLRGHRYGVSRERLERGQGMVEYGLILALIAIGVIAVLVTLGDDIAGTFQDTGTQLRNPPTGTR